MTRPRGGRKRLHVGLTDSDAMRDSTKHFEWGDQCWRRQHQEWLGTNVDNTRAHDRVNAAQTVDLLSFVQRPTNLVSPDNRRIAGIGDDITIIFWDVESKQKVFDLLVKQTNRVQLELLSYTKDIRYINSVIALRECRSVDSNQRSTSTNC
ncbi:hypothetical protein CY34DRAFT_797533 [Suillus luteus UH-Slu-Lm8-n1]|uniref:Uncharacterized protein n=1 Tax=Suillus luteus UH-Slu-Lm8-n1 TaxID=930992 RepID=A0A0D0B504_9AGAM|nr:hypothetical protein CY34DRAFT_797533 [Suillus luteus UH-Slu-Lm8-n1]